MVLNFTNNLQTPIHITIKNILLQSVLNSASLYITFNYHSRQINTEIHMQRTETYACLAKCHKKDHTHYKNLSANMQQNI